MQMKNVEETEYINNLKKKQILNINNLIKSKSEQDQIQALDLLLDNVYRLDIEDFTLKVIQISDTRNFDLKKKINRFLILYANESKYLVLTFNTILKDLRDHNIQLVYLAIDFIGSINYIDEYFVKYFVDLARTGDSEMRKILCKNMNKMFLNKSWVEKYDMLPLLNEMTLDFNNIYALELIFEIDHLYKVFDNEYIISMLTKCNHPYEGKLILLMIIEKRIKSNQKIIKTTCNSNTIVNKNDLDTNKDTYFENNDKKCGINNFDKQFNFTKYENDVDEIYFQMNANEKHNYFKKNKTDCLDVLENLSINENFTKKDINYEYNCSFENKLIDKITKICLQYLRCPRLEFVYQASKIILKISNNHSQIVYDHLKKFIKHGTVKTYFILEFIREMIKNQKLYDFNYDNSDFLIFKDDPEYIKRLKLDILHLQHDEISKKETLFCVFDQLIIFDCLHLMLKKDYTCKNLLRKCFLTNVSMTIDILYENLPFDRNWFEIINDFLINCKISRKYHKKVFLY
ncbi:hypothetical protein GVAV_003031 [Gurleya vavrai]